MLHSHGFKQTVDNTFWMSQEKQSEWQGEKNVTHIMICCSGDIVSFAQNGTEYLE